MVFKEVPMKPALEYVDFNFFYGGHQVLKDINLKFENYNINALIGPSGCGKSTLLRAANRIYELYENHQATGKINLEGLDILSQQMDVIRLRSKVGMVFQKPTPFPMSIYDNVAFGVKLYESLPHKELEERVEGALKKAAIWNEVKDKLKSSAMSLSGGQQQRLCIARAIAMNPKVLLLDEPTSALDPISTIKIEELIQQLKNECCIVLVTHNLQQAARATDYTGFLLAGQVVEFGKTETMFTTPKNKTTEDYISGRFG
jgi:phosphate transport system ATP-binding protein